MVKLIRALFLACTILAIPFKVFAQAPVANFSATPTVGCTPIVVQFTDLSTGNPTSWSWNLGNGTNSTLQNPSTTYTAAGSYTVTLTVTNTSGTNTKTVANYIVASPTPIMAFTASDTTSGCPPKTVTFTNQTIPNSAGTTNYYWDFGDGFTSNAASPTHTYTTVGNFTVTLVATNGAGCTNSITKTSYIHTAAKPTAFFTATNNNSCTTPLNVTFNNSSAGGVSYLWYFGDGTTSNIVSPQHQYNNIGSYTVTLIVTNSGGCSDTLVRPAYVNIGSLTSDFTSNTSSTCTGNTVSFTNTTTPGAGASLWSFGDGATSTATNPTHAYAAAGTYTVKLKSNYNNCADSVTHTITVLTGPSTSFTASPLSGCSIPFTTTFSNTTTGAISFLWLFGDGTTSTAPNPSHTYTAYGSYTVKLVSTSANGCNDTMTKPAYINITPIASTIIPSSGGGCVPQTIGFTLSYTGGAALSSINWSFGDGSSSTALAPSHTYTVSGTYTVVVNITTTTGCTSSATTTIVVTPKPVAGFTVTPSVVCTNSPVSFTSTTTGAVTYVYYFGDGSSSGLQDPVHAYGAAGVYSVTLVASNGFCTDTFTIQNAVTVLLPNAGFTATYPCSNRKQWTFTNTSVGNTTNTWNFGDGTTSTAVNPTHTYANFGTYNVTLTVTNAATGCTSTIVIPVNIVNVMSAFTADDTTLCPGNTVTCTLLTPYLPGVTYYWNSGVGTYTGTNNPIATTYASPGIYTMKVIATDGLGCQDSTLKTIYVGGATVLFTAAATAGCSPLPVTFTDASTPNSGFAIISRSWSFGDGGTLTTTATTVSHTYVAAGSYTVTLTITDANGCVTSQTRTAYISVTKPNAIFSSPDTVACITTPVQFVNNSVGVATVTYAWSFGDGGTSTAITPAHTYSAPGNYTVRLIATDGNGCKDTLTRAAYIHINTIAAAFTMSDSTANCPPLTVTFTNNSTGATSYLWNFGNGVTSTQANPVAIFSTPGTFIVKLKAFGGSGCVDSFSRTVTISGGPSGTLSYTPSAGCGSVTITFTVNAINTTTKTFDFDNGVTQTTTANTVTYTYTQPGIYVPKVILSNGIGCNTSIIGADTIKLEKVNAGFSAVPNPVCAGVAVQFTDTSTTAVNPVTTRAWNFGDGGTSAAANPTHAYATSGVYTVRLIVATAAGCPDTVYHTITVNPLPVITAANATVCGGTPVQLNATGAATYLWSPATGLSCITCANPVASPAATTTYTVTGTSAAGCVSTTNVTVNLNALPVVSAGANQSICGGGSVQLTATGAATYVWLPATGLSCTACANPTASPATTTVYTVTGTSSAGCSATSSVTVNVGTNPAISVTPPASICAGGSVVLTASGANSYTWSPATGLSCSNCSNPIATPGTTTTYTVTGTATNGCTGTATVTVTVNPQPTVSAGLGAAICAGGSTTLTATGATTYSWAPATGLSCTTCASPVASPAATTTYTVTGTTNGCTNTAQVTVTVNQLPVVSAGANVAICTGASTSLTATGASTYSWSPATGLSCTTCANPVASPAATTTYTVTGTNGGCSATATVTVTINPPPTVSAGANQSICPGGSTILTATGAATYVWSPSTGLSCTACASPVASPTANTTYTVTGTNAGGCTGTATVTVSINNTPTITVSGNTSFCAGGSTTLTAGGATTYSWSPAAGLSATTGATVTANPAATTTYTVTGTSGIGCTGTTTVTVTVNPIPVVGAGSNVAVCAGAGTTLQATGAATYVWSPATGLSCTACTSPVASPAATTTYTVTGTSTGGCTGTAAVTVTVNPLPVVTAGSNTSVCPGGSATLTAGGAASYVWSPATGLSCTACASPVASPAATTTYTVTGTGANGCTNTAQVTVSVNAVPVVTVIGNTNICSGFPTALNATGAATYVWSPAAGLSCTACANPTASPAATTTYTVTGTSGVGCTASTTVTVTIHTPPTVSAGAAQSVCAGTPAQLQASGAASYTWSPATGLSCTACANPLATPAATTTYTVTGTDAFGCTGTGTVTVSIQPLPIISAGPDVSICRTTGTQLTATGGASYVWSPATGLSCTACANPVASPAATTTYTVTGTGANGCTATDAITVSIYAQPPVNAGPDQTICSGQSAQLQASGASAYVWSPATALSCTTCSNPLATPSSAITYSVIGTDANGCSDSDKVVITVTPKIPVTITPSGEICEGETSQLTATGGDTYAWSPAATLSNATIANPVATPTQTTTYQVVIKQGQCFADTLRTTVTVHPKPVINAGPDQSIVAGTSVQIITTSAFTDTYLWTPALGLSCTACAIPVASPDKTTTYTVEAANSYGCKASDEVIINVRCDGNQVWLPNTFTPNGDGENDRFYPHGRGLERVARFRIYDRWGELLFDANNIPVNDKTYGWDGTFKNQVLKPDVYVWIINATCTTGEPIEAKGDISLVR